VGRPAADHRRFLNAVFGILRTGAPWRDLPPTPATGSIRIAAAAGGAIGACGLLCGRQCGTHRTVRR